MIHILRILIILYQVTNMDNKTQKRHRVLLFIIIITTQKILILVLVVLLRNRYV